MLEWIENYSRQTQIDNNRERCCAFIVEENRGLRYSWNVCEFFEATSRSSISLSLRREEYFNIKVGKKFREFKIFTTLIISLTRFKLDSYYVSYCYDFVWNRGVISYRISYIRISRCSIFYLIGND